jgi:NAD(P)-dependent dehydrogenase (short-subunit alcohol dehydrogenase family)
MTGQRAEGVAIVTGAAGGMGSHCARLLAEDGWDDLILCDLAAERIEPVAEALRGKGARVKVLPGQLTDPAFHQRLVEALKGRKIGALIHTAGVSPTMTDSETLLSINLDGTLLLVDAIRAHMAEGAAAVLYASMASYFPIAPEADAAFEAPMALGDWRAHMAMIPNSGIAYTLAKRAVRAIARREAKRFGEHGARIVSVSPGLIDTAMGSLEENEHTRGMLANAALPRLGRPEELAAASVYLCSPGASFITGIDLLVDGGAVAALGR